MIRISYKELNSGIDLSRKIDECKNSHDCLWSKRANLFSGYLPQACPKEKCIVPIFRKKFEGDSPLYYAEALGLSQWWCVSGLATLDEWRKKERIDLEKGIHDLGIYEQLVALVIHPLDLAVRRIPLFKPGEIETLKKGWGPKEKSRTVQTMREINPAWVSRLEVHLENIHFNLTYHDAVFYLAYLFFKGLEKNQLPDNEKLFSEIEKSLRV